MMALLFMDNMKKYINYFSYNDIMKCFISNIYQKIIIKNKIIIPFNPNVEFNQFYKKNLLIKISIQDDLKNIIVSKIFLDNKIADIVDFISSYIDTYNYPDFESDFDWNEN
jgi:hypothetical protein